jgi:hypothetical protein
MTWADGFSAPTRYLPSDLRPAFGSTCGETRSRWGPRNPGQQSNWGFRHPQVNTVLARKCSHAEIDVPAIETILSPFREQVEGEWENNARPPTP